MTKQELANMIISDNQHLLRTHETPFKYNLLRLKLYIKRLLNVK